MGRLCTSFALLLAVVSLSGCETIQKIISGEPDMLAVAPTWQEPGRIRPGIALIIQVGTPSAPPTTVNVLVEA